MQKFLEIMYLVLIATSLVAPVVPDDSTNEESASGELIQRQTPFGRHRSPRPGFVMITKKTHNISIGEYYEIICEVRHVFKMSDIFWIRGDEFESTIKNLQRQKPPLHIVTDSRSALTLVKSKYIIKSATEEDAGKYSCGVFSEDNRSYVYSAVVNVQSGDVKAHKKPGPVIVENVVSVISEIGSNVTLYCRATDNAKITWLGMDNQTFENIENYKIKGGVLKINSITWDNGGDHTCVAETSHGHDRQTTFLYPASPSD